MSISRTKLAGGECELVASISLSTTLQLRTQRPAQVVATAAIHPGHSSHFLAYKRKFHSVCIVNCSRFMQRPPQVVATTDIIDGDELCFSYGERSNDDFFVHYGFVPLRNPRDEVILFESVESALDWYALESGLPVGVGGTSGDEEADKEVLVRDLRRIGAPCVCALPFSVIPPCISKVM